MDKPKQTSLKLTRGQFGYYFEVPEGAEQFAMNYRTKGFLEKHGSSVMGMGGGWQRRFFVLVPTTMLMYFTSKTDTVPHGIFLLNENTTVEHKGPRTGHPGEEFLLSLDPTDPAAKKIRMSADSSADANAWVSAILKERVNVVNMERDDLQRKNERLTQENDALSKTVEELKKEVDHYKSQSNKTAQVLKDQQTQLDEGLSILHSLHISVEALHHAMNELLPEDARLPPPRHFDRTLPSKEAFTLASSNEGAEAPGATVTPVKAGGGPDLRRELSNASGRSYNIWSDDEDSDHEGDQGGERKEPSSQTRPPRSSPLRKGPSHALHHVSRQLGHLLTGLMSSREIAAACDHLLESVQQSLKAEQQQSAKYSQALLLFKQQWDSSRKEIEQLHEAIATGRAEYESLLSRHNETLKLMMENSAKSGASSASSDKAGQLTVGIPPARPRRRSSVEPKLYHSPFPVSQAYDDPSTFGFSIGGTVISETLGMLHVKILRITGLHKSGLFSSHSHVAIKLQLGQSISSSDAFDAYTVENKKYNEVKPNFTAELKVSEQLSGTGAKNLRLELNSKANFRGTRIGTAAIDCSNLEAFPGMTHGTWVALQDCDMDAAVVRDFELPCPIMTRRASVAAAGGSGATASSQPSRRFSAIDIPGQSKSATSNTDQTESVFADVALKDVEEMCQIPPVMLRQKTSKPPTLVLMLLQYAARTERSVNPSSASGGAMDSGGPDEYTPSVASDISDPAAETPSVIAHDVLSPDELPKHDIATVMTKYKKQKKQLKYAKKLIQDLRNRLRDQEQDSKEEV